MPACGDRGRAGRRAPARRARRRGRGRRPSHAVGTDLDDAAIPLLTPTDDVADEGAGLPIVLDLGPEPPLRTAGRTAVPVPSLPPLSPGPRSPAPGRAAAASSASGAPYVLWRSLPAWVRWSIAAAVPRRGPHRPLAFAGRLARPAERPRRAGRIRYRQAQSRGPSPLARAGREEGAGHRRPLPSGPKADEEGRLRPRP